MKKTAWRKALVAGSIFAVEFLVSLWAAGCLVPEPEDPMPGDADVLPMPEVLPDPDISPPPPDPDLVPQPDPLPPDGTPDPGVPDGLIPPVGTPVFTDAVLTPDGKHLLVQTEQDGGPCLAVAVLDSNDVFLPEGQCHLRWVTPAAGGGAAYLLQQSGSAVAALDLDTMGVYKTFTTDDVYSVMESSDEGDSLALSNQPVDEWSESQYEWSLFDMDLRHLAVVRPGDGAVHEQTFPYAIRSVGFSPVDGAVLVAMSHWKADGLPEALVHFMNPATGVVEDQLTFPNCADEVVPQPGGTRAILSPNRCFVHPVVLTPPEPEEEWPEPEEEWDDWDEMDEADPASVIDLEERKFVGNLPGFGPVAFSADGATAVAFSRQETMMKQWNFFQQKLVGLVVIRMEDLYWQVVEYGGDEPDYFFDATGANLLLHDQDGGQDRIVRMDAQTHALTVLSGPPTHFDQKAATPDGKTIFAVVDGKLRRIDAGADTIKEAELPFDVRQVFIRPQNDFVVVTAADGKAVHLLDVATLGVVKSVSLQ